MSFFAFQNAGNDLVWRKNEMQKCEQLYEGKAKKVFLTDDPDILIVSYKDDATAFNGLKKGTIVGKGAINNRMYTQRTKVGYYHGAVEGACVYKALGQPAEIVHHAQNRNGKAEKEAGQLAESLSHVLSVVVALRGLYLINLLVELEVHVHNSVGRLKLHLDGSFGCVNGEAALDCHDNLYGILGIYAAACHEAVYARQHGNAAYIGCNKKMQKTDALVACNTQLAQSLIHIAYKEGLLVVIMRVVSGRHYVRNEFIERRQRAYKAAILAVTVASFISAHASSSGKYKVLIF